MYQPTATAITIIIASSIASSIDVRPFIGVEYLFTYKFCVAPRRINGGGSRRTRPFSAGRLGLWFRPARRVGPFGSACRRRRRRLSASSMRPEALRDAVTGAARRRRPLDCLRRAAPWAGRRRGGLGGGRASPAVVFVMSTGGDADGLSSRSRSGTSARPESSRHQGSGVSGLRDAEILGRAPTGGGVERLAIYCTLKTIYNYFGEGWRGGLPTSARLYAGELEELYRRSLKGAVFEDREAQRLYRGGLVGGRGGGDRPARPRRGRRGASAGCPATRVYWPALPSEKSWANGKTRTPFGPGRGSGWGSDCGGEGLRRKALRRVGGCRGSPAWRGWGR
jgi:hypothetical protein